MSERVVSIQAGLSTRTLERAAWRLDLRKHPAKVRCIEDELRRRREMERMVGRKAA